MRIAPPRLPAVLRSPALVVCCAATLVMFAIATSRAAEPLPGTAPLVIEGDIASQLVAGADKFLLGEIAASVGRRPKHWHRDVSSAEKYGRIGSGQSSTLGEVYRRGRSPAADRRTAIRDDNGRLPYPRRVAPVTAHAIRWPVFQACLARACCSLPRAEKSIANVIAIPDADQTPEMLAGLTPGIPPEAQFARRLAESGCRVIVPMLIDRSDRFSQVIAGTQPTNLPDRELIYRQAFEMGRHIIGYEVQKILSLVDWFQHEQAAKIGVYGYGEGGLIALYASAIDPRIDVTVTSGYFRSRQRVWEEPIYRNVFGLLDEFGDAEIATLVAPRSLIVEACRGPEVSGPPAPGKGRPPAAAPGSLDSPALDEVEREVARAKELVSSLSLAGPFEVIASQGGSGLPGSDRQH